MLEACSRIGELKSQDPNTDSGGDGVWRKTTETITPCMRSFEGKGLERQRLEADQFGSLDSLPNGWSGIRVTGEEYATKFLADRAGLGG
nr:hypothetical protein Itr_chr14CG03380 [Ipomoea trifida]